MPLATSEAEAITQFVEQLRQTMDISQEELALVLAAGSLAEAMNVAGAVTGLSPVTLTAMVNEILHTEELAAWRAGRRIAGRERDIAMGQGEGGLISAVIPTPKPASMATGVRSRAPTTTAGIMRTVFPVGETTPQGVVSGYDETGLPVFDASGIGGVPEEQEGLAGGFPTDYRPLINVPTGGHRVSGRAPTRANTQVEAWGPAPLYYEFDTWRFFAGKSPEYIAEVKQRLIAAGIIDEAEAGPLGHWRVEDSRTMYSIMAEANASGKTWMDVVDEYAANPAPEEKVKAWRAANPFVAPVFRAPDYASLTQAVRAAFASEVGRLPKDYELALLADQLRADFNSQHAATVAAARAEYEATARAQETESPQVSGTVADVDPLARLEQAILSRYGPEIERVTATQESGVNVGLMMRSLAGLEQAVG